MANFKGIKHFIYILLTISLFSACKSGGEGETIAFSDLSKPSAKYGNKDSLTVKTEIAPVYYDSISVFSQQLADSLAFDKNNLFKLDTLIYPDRFGAEKTDKWYYLATNDSLVFMRWEFKNNVKARNSFFNWLDCYGPKCKSISVNDKVNFSKRATMLLMEGKEIIFVESSRKIDSEKLVSIVSNLKKQKQWEYFVLQQPKGKASWKFIDKEGVAKEILLESVTGEAEAGFEPNVNQ